MKCLCGYEHKSGFDDGKWKDNLIGDEEFIRLTPDVFETQTGFYSYDTSKVSLYACPKCNTVRME